MTIKNLALKGGGVKGIAYVGALKELENAGLYEGIRAVSGTSAGAIVAGMIALGFSADEIEKLMHGLDFKKFKKGWNPIRIFTKYGLYDGDYILEFIRKFLAKSSHGFDEDVTFQELKDANCKDLIVFASDLNTHRIHEFSALSTPNCIVAEAIRASMSIPLFFRGWRFTNGIPNDHIYVDGGVVFNYPLSFFDKPRFHKNQTVFNNESIGLYLESKRIYEEHETEDELKRESDRTDSKKSKKHYLNKFSFNSKILLYIKHLFDTLMNAQDIDFMEESHLVRRTIFIDDLGISATDFDLTRTDMDNLVESGRKGALRYFEYLNEQESAKS